MEAKMKENDKMFFRLVILSNDFVLTFPADEFQMEAAKWFL